MTAFELLRLAQLAARARAQQLLLHLVEDPQLRRRQHFGGARRAAAGCFPAPMRTALRGASPLGVMMIMPVPMPMPEIPHATLRRVDRICLRSSASATMSASAWSSGQVARHRQAALRSSVDGPRVRSWCSGMPRTSADARRPSRSVISRAFAPASSRADGAGDPARRIEQSTVRIFSCMVELLLGQQLDEAARLPRRHQFSACARRGFKSAHHHLVFARASPHAARGHRARLMICSWYLRCSRLDHARPWRSRVLARNATPLPASCTSWRRRRWWRGGWRWRVAGPGRCRSGTAPRRRE